jgi:hypothetical protein
MSYYNLYLIEWSVECWFQAQNNVTVKGGLSEDLHSNCMLIGYHWLKNGYCAVLLLVILASISVSVTVSLAAEWRQPLNLV